MTTWPRHFTGRRTALSGCFLAGGIGIGTWGANLPALGRRAMMSEAELGITLLCFAAGAILAMVNAPRLMRVLGAGRSAAVAAALFGLVVILVALAQSMLVAGIVAALGGLCFGTLDVTMNKEAATLEARAGKPIMASFHAIFSAGTLISAMIYAALVKAGASVPVCLIVAGAMIAVVAVMSLQGLPAAPPTPAKSAPTHTAAANARPGYLRVLMLGGMAFLAFFAEGAILDWIAVFMVRVMGASESMGAFSYALFAGAMTVGRLVGDRVNSLLGAVTLFRLGTVTMAAGLAVVLSTSSTPVILVALSICGLGVANIIPVIFSTAGRLGHADGGKTMSLVLTMGYAGILIGPALIGFVAEISTLTWSLSIVVVAMVSISFCGRLLQSNRLHS